LGGGFLDEADFVFHFAGQTSLRAAEENPDLNTRLNLSPVIRFIETCEARHLSPGIIFAGTATQVGLTETLPVSEDSKDNPLTAYDKNKLEAEKKLVTYVKNGKGSAVTLRLSNVYGPGGVSSSPDRGIVNQMIQKALHREELKIFGGGNFLRDYVYIEDVIRAFLYTGTCLEETRGNYYFIGSGVGTKVKEMVHLVSEKVKQITGINTKMVEEPFPREPSPIEVRNFIADPSLFCELTRWRPEVSLAEGIEKTVNYFMESEK